MDVMLINPPSTSRIRRIFGEDVSYLDVLRATYLDEDILQSFPGENLGLEYVAADLRSKDYEVEIVDACLEELSEDDVVRRILGISPLVVGFTGPEAIFWENVELIKKLKEHDFSGHITLGGDYATKASRKILRKIERVDSICLGEGEGVFADLVGCIKRGKDFRGLENLAYRDEDRIVVGKPKVWRSLDSAPWPVRDQAEMTISKGFSLSMSTSRGCPYMRCEFCTAPKGWRFRSADSIIKEIEYLVGRFGVKWITFVDEDFIGGGEVGKQRAEHIARRILKSGINIQYMIDCRADAVERDLFSLLKESGLRRVFVGFESGVQRILDIYKKGFTLERSREALKILRELVLDTIPGFIFFDPFSSVGEMLESLRFFETIGYYDMIRFAHRLHIDASMPIYNTLLRQGKVKCDVMDDRYDFSEPQIRDIHGALWSYIRRIFPGYLKFSRNRDMLSQREISRLKSIHTQCFLFLLKNASKGREYLESICSEHIKEVNHILGSSY